MYSVWQKYLSSASYVSGKFVIAILGFKNARIFSHYLPQGNKKNKKLCLVDYLE